jgi:hypothetical protein
MIANYGINCLGLYKVELNEEVIVSIYGYRMYIIL